MNTTEKKAMRIVNKRWPIYAGCDCTPEIAKKGSGCDLLCKHKHVEVKGTAQKVPSFRFITSAGFLEAKRNKRFEMWLVADINGKPTVYWS